MDYWTPLWFTPTLVHFTGPNYTHIICRTDQSEVADRRDADDRLCAVAYAPLYKIMKEIRKARYF